MRRPCTLRSIAASTIGTASLRSRTTERSAPLFDLLPDVVDVEVDEVAVRVPKPPEPDADEV